MRRVLALLASILALGCFTAAPASAAFGFENLDVTFEEEDGSPALLAGSHPFALSTTLGVITHDTPEGKVPDGEIKDLNIAQIPGFVGSQTAVPTCKQAEFNNRNESRPSCPDETAVGYAAAEVEFEVIPPAEAGNAFHVPVYNLDPPPGVAAELGFVVLNVPVTIDITVSPDQPDNLIAKLSNVPQAILLYRSQVILWGNPESPAHDELRGNCLGEVANTSPEPISLGSCPVSAPEVAFLTLPRACGGPLQTVFSAISWAGVPAGGITETHDEIGPKGMEGCEDLEFHPHASAQPTTTQASSSTGLNFGLEIEDEGLTDPEGRAQSDIEQVEVTLPEGMTINPSAAEGLGACSPTQYEAEGLQWSPFVGCPQSSKIGSVEVESPLLNETLDGQLYIAEQENNPFHSLFALYMVIRSERYGVLVRQAGEVQPDLQAGRLRSTFKEIPQLPFSHFRVKFREGPRAPLIAPPKCGTYATGTTFTPYSGAAPVTESTPFEVTSGPGGGPCPQTPPPFAPGLQAGTLQSQAGAFSPFYMHITRSDSEQEITRFDSVLPPGLVGKIAGLGRCPEAAIAQAKISSGRAELANPSCPAASRVGKVIAGAGVGGALTYVEGSLYLAGPYGGDPLSIVAITPAVTGPFDIGTVVIREALTLNPVTAQVEVDGAASDPIPHILKGVPLHLRDLRVAIDRPEFTLNATSCEPESLAAAVFGSGADPLSAADDVPAVLADRYQASGCAALAFRPKLGLKLKGSKKNMKRSGHPALSAVLTPRAGDANLKGTTVLLPHSMFIDQFHISNPCTRVQYSEGTGQGANCPKGSILGTVKAWTPLLDEPLEGKIYFRTNGGERELPDVVLSLDGQFHIEQVGFVDSKHERLRTRFTSVPDALISKVQIKFFGGKRGLLENSANLCASKQKARVTLAGQNGRNNQGDTVIQTPSCKKHKRRAGRAHKRKASR